jgi:heme A synthase
VSALLAALAAWALVAVGGVVRITESGLGCPDWPLCEGRVVPVSQKEPVLEWTHRVVAAVSIALVALVVLWAWRRYRGRRDILLPAGLALLFVPFQAVLGAIVVWLETPGWLVGVHFVIGLGYLALAVLAAVAAWEPKRAQATPRFAKLALVALAAGVVLVSLGAAVSAMNAGYACGTDWPACNGSFASGGAEGSVQVAHRLAAYVVAALAIVLAVLALRREGPRVAGSLPVAAVLGQIALGIAAVSLEPGTARDVFVILHIAGAGAVWAGLVVLAARVGLPRRAAGDRRLGVPVTAR